MADEEDVVDSSESGNEQGPEPQGLSVDDSRSCRRAKKIAWLSDNLIKRENRARSKRVSNILKKSEESRTQEEVEFLSQCPDVVEKIHKSAFKRSVYKQRTLELHDPEEELDKKCQQLAEAIKASTNLVIYTGAGISTAASIPDYRGPNGVWTLLQKGQFPEAQDLSDAEPTFTHMCLPVLYTEGHLMHVVSQNCDGLHLRSGIPRKILSEVHGNMFLELCCHCKPQQEYFRLFDVTEKTGVRKHQTDRKCHSCKKPLKDTIVHFGEKGGIKSPYCWKEASKAAENCDVILCLGTSLKVLKVYSCLWCMDRRPSKRPKLYIVNLQWTPKDDSATLKINGNCDEVMKRVMQHLGYNVPLYAREFDPLFTFYVALKPHEKKTTKKKILEVPEFVTKKTIRKKNKGLKGVMKQESGAMVKIESESLENTGDVDVVEIPQEKNEDLHQPIQLELQVNQESQLFDNLHGQDQLQQQFSMHQGVSASSALLSASSPSSSSSAVTTILPPDFMLSPRKHDIAHIIPNIVTPTLMTSNSGTNGLHTLNSQVFIPSATFPPCPKCGMTVRLAGLCACFKGVPFIQVPNLSQGSHHISSLNTGVIDPMLYRNNAPFPLPFGPQIQNMTLQSQLQPLPLINFSLPFSAQCGVFGIQNTFPMPAGQVPVDAILNRGSNHSHYQEILSSGSQTFNPSAIPLVAVKNNISPTPPTLAKNFATTDLSNNGNLMSEIKSGPYFTSSENLVTANVPVCIKDTVNTYTCTNSLSHSIEQMPNVSSESITTLCLNTQQAIVNTQKHDSNGSPSFKQQDHSVKLEAKILHPTNTSLDNHDNPVPAMLMMPTEESSKSFARPKKLSVLSKIKDELKRPRSFSSLSEANVVNEKTDSDSPNKGQLSRSMSVPGWYGKGLNFKKRKK